jgi:hypothetical protein
MKKMKCKDVCDDTSLQIHRDKLNNYKKFYKKEEVL